jgi:hypothetical protein
MEISIYNDKNQCGILINAWDCATFANAIDRLGCKMIWLIPFFSLIALFNTLQQKS